MNFLVSSSGISSLPISFNYATSAGTATPAIDYVEKSGSLTIPAGFTTTTISVLINGDTLGEGTETLTVTLNGASNISVVGSDLIATGSIGGTYLENVVSVTASWNAVCAIADTAKDLYCWGTNTQNSYMAAASNKAYPSKILLAAEAPGVSNQYLSGVTEVRLGFAGNAATSICALNLAKELLCWADIFANTFPGLVSSSLFESGHVQNIASMSGTSSTYWVYDGEGRPYAVGVSSFNSIPGATDGIHLDPTFVDITH